MSDQSLSPDDEAHAPAAPKPFVVGIGASAGGLEALEKLFEHMPADTGMVFVVIQHLSPDFKSLTDTLLARRTAIPIRQAENGMPVEPDVCYLLPPRKDMILSDGKLLLTDKDPAPAVALPIDRFLRSIAQDAGDRAVAVILSGTGSDGSRGIRDVHAAGGLVIAQAPETAKFDGMPKSAVATGTVDYALPPGEIPAALQRHADHPGHRELPDGPADGPLPAGMDAIFGLLRDACGIDFAAYKPETIGRRIERRMGLLHVPTVEEYADRLTSDPGEVNLLYKDLLIGVTRFFRDPEAFERLGREVLPRLLSTLGRDDDFRVWVAACATGEEAYTLGIVVQECLDALPRSVGVKIFATDAHRASLDVAGAGVYPADSLAAMTPARRDRFFVPKGGAYQVAPDLRKQVVFAQHNVLKDAPFTRLDLIVCRNLLIYFLPPAQKKVLSLFHFGLKTGGALFLGPSEGPGDLADEFDTVNARWKVYRKRRDVRLAADIRLPVPLAARALVSAGDRPAGAAATPPDAPLTGVLDMLLDECLTPAVLVNDRRQVVRTFAGASRFLDLRDGWFSADVLDAVRPELRPVLAGALPRALGENVPVTFKGLPVRLPDGDRVIDVRVKPVRAKRSGDAYALVTLAEAGGPPAPASREMDLGEASREHVLSLEADLRSAKESLQATIEELETSNEELQATNEELTASNEELQSTNEELHSVNEELYTVNGEYQKKIEELTELTADMENLLASTEVHTIFLDRELRVRKFTPRVADTFNLLAQDVGRRIDHFTHTIDHPGLLDDLRAVLAGGAPVERQVRDRRGGWFLLRVLPYRAGGGVGGVVLTLVDIGRVKQAEADARRKDEQLAGILRNSPNWVFIKDVGGKYLMADEAFKRLVGCDPVGKAAHDLFPTKVADALVAQDADVLRAGAADEREVTIPHPDGPHTYLSIMFPMRDEAGAVTGLGGIRTDVTALKRAEREAREAVAQRDRFLAVLSHELRNPLAAVVNAADVLARLGGGPADAARWLGVVERRSRHMARLLDDLLDVARIAQNKIEIRRVVFDLGAVTRDVLEEVRRAFDERRIRLTVECPDGPLPVAGDPARLQQVQVNLLMNAAKYTPDGGEVWYALGAEGGEAVVRVRDTGVGMSPDLLARAFDLFVQADDTLDRADGGMGVGLTLVRAIVELHGGRVTARSDGPGAGSEFVVRLPLAAVPAPAPDAAPAAGPARARRVLVVEDDPDIRESLRSILVLDGHEVEAVADGPAALALLDRDPLPDVALVDIGIPGLSGYEVARRIRATTDGRLRLVALTGYGRPGDREAALAAGFDAHLTKPFHPRDLGTILGAGDAT